MYYSCMAKLSGKETQKRPSSPKTPEEFDTACLLRKPLSRRPRLQKIPSTVQYGILTRSSCFSSVRPSYMCRSLPQMPLVVALRMHRSAKLILVLPFITNGFPFSTPRYVAVSACGLYFVPPLTGFRWTAGYADREPPLASLQTTNL